MILFAILATMNSCKQKPNESEEYYRKGNDYVLNADFANARKQYELCLKADSTNWRACYQIANVYELEGDFANAFHYFDKAIAINPNFTLGYFNLSNLQEMVGDEKGSIRNMELKKDFFMAQLTKGRKDYSAGRFAAAIQDFDSAINLRKDFYLAYSLRGSCKFKTGDFAGAVSDFGTEIQLNPGHLMGYVNRAVAKGRAIYEAILQITYLKGYCYLVIKPDMEISYDDLKATG